MPLITRTGPAPDHELAFVPHEDWTGPEEALALPNDADPTELPPDILLSPAIRIPFPSSHDGRGFSLARRLRDLGYTGRLRAAGHVISDQFRYALDCGFDEVEIAEALADRQPLGHWTGDLPSPRSYRDKLARRRAAPVHPAPAGVLTETVTSIRHYTDRLFSFRTTRAPGFRFQSGEFAMIGLPNAEKPVFRAYSVASPAWDEELEFYSIKVPGGPLTEALKDIRPGDPILLRPKATGTLIADALTPAPRLYLFATGTGIAPYASLIRDPELYDRFGKVILVQTCRTAAELDYGRVVVARTRRDPLVGPETEGRLLHYAATTREPSQAMGRIPQLIATGALQLAFGLPAFGPADRAMICGSAEMVRDLRAVCEEHGLTEGSRSRPGDFVFERAFVG